MNPIMYETFVGDIDKQSIFIFGCLIALLLVVGFFMLLVDLFFKVKDSINLLLLIELITHTETNRMAGIRFGKHEDRGYLRFDLWSKSYRWTLRNQDTAARSEK